MRKHPIAVSSNRLERQELANVATVSSNSTMRLLLQSILRKPKQVLQKNPTKKSSGSKKNSKRQASTTGATKDKKSRQKQKQIVVGSSNSRRRANTTRRGLERKRKQYKKAAMALNKLAYLPSEEDASGDGTLSTQDSSSSFSDSWNDSWSSLKSGSGSSLPIVDVDEYGLVTLRSEEEGGGVDVDELAKEREAAELLRLSTFSFESDDGGEQAPPEGTTSDDVTPYRQRERTQRLKLSRKANWRLVTAMEIIAWQTEKQALMTHKANVENQRRVLRTLRTTSRMLRRPFRRCFLPVEEAATHQVMFSAIHEGEADEEQDQQEGLTAAAKIEDEHLSVEETESESVTESASDEEELEAAAEPTQPIFFDGEDEVEEADYPTAEELLSKMGLDEEEEEEYSSPEEEEEEALTTSVLAASSIFRRSVDADADRVDAQPEHKTDDDKIETESTNGTFTTIHRRHSEPLLPRSSKDDSNSNNLVLTDRYALLIMATHQQHVGPTQDEDRIQSCMEILKAASSYSSSDETLEVHDDDDPTTTSVSFTGDTDATESTTTCSSSVTSAEECKWDDHVELGSSDQAPVTPTKVGGGMADDDQLVTDHFANLIMSKHQQHRRLKRRHSSGMEVLRSISSSIRACGIIQEEESEDEEEKWEDGVVSARPRGATFTHHVSLAYGEAIAS